MVLLTDRSDDDVTKREKVQIVMWPYFSDFLPGLLL